MLYNTLESQDTGAKHIGERYQRYRSKRYRLYDLLWCSGQRIDHHHPWQSQYYPPGAGALVPFTSKLPPDFSDRTPL